jgi:hypothetical protein
MKPWPYLSQLILVFLFASPASFASDLAQAIQLSEDPPRSENGGFLELGLSIEARRTAFATKVPDDDNGELELGLYLSGGYRYERLFVEATESWFGGLNMGVTLLETEHWSFDFLAANIAGVLTLESDEPQPVSEQERNSAILDRDSLFIAAGPRLTGYFGDNIVQLRVVSDWYDDNGVLGSLRFGRQWQLGNWNFQGIVGTRYYSEQFSDYLFGVDADEATNRFPEFQASSAFLPEVEVGASVPVSKDWVFSTRVRARQLPGDVQDSPLITAESEVFWNTSLYYVF